MIGRMNPLTVALCFAAAGVGMTLRQLSQAAPQMLSQATLKAIDEELKRLRR